MKKLILLLLCGLLTGVPLWCASQPLGDRGVILIISSYNPDTRRMSSFISEFEQQIVSSKIPQDIYIENLECRGVADAPIWMNQMESVICRYETKGLRAIILLGQEAWATFLSLEHIPSNIQVFGCFASANGVLLPPPEGFESSESRWMPESIDLVTQADSLCQGVAGGLFTQYDIRRNIDLITTIYPEAETIAFVSDNTYGGISLQALVRKEMAEYYPQLRLELIDSRAGDSLVNMTYAALLPKSATLIGTWHVGQDGECLMQRSLTELVKLNPKIPVFSVTGSGAGEAAVGGFIPQYESGAKAIAEQIIHAHNVNDLDNAHFHFIEGAYRFDARKLKEFKIPEYALPPNSIIEDTMAAKLSKYSHYIFLLSIALGLLISLLLFIFWLLFRTWRLTHTLKAREDELVIAREKAEESGRLKSAFLANISHEIRTPLNSIVGFSSLMGSKELSIKERTEYSSIVINNSEMLLTLLNDILDISSLECGKTRFNYTSEDIVQICQHVMLTTAHTRKEGVEGVFVPPCTSMKLITDIHRLSQILINLLTNASKFTVTGSVTLTFEVREQERMVYFSVTDTGSGIPTDKQEAVFNRFEKLEGNSKMGTGLGLAICRQTAAIFGGGIWVDPQYKKGARFIFTHPLNIVPPNPEQAGESRRTI